MKKCKVISLMLVVTLVAIIFAGCGSSNVSTGSLVDGSISTDSAQENNEESTQEVVAEDAVVVPPSVEAPADTEDPPEEIAKVELPIVEEPVTFSYWMGLNEQVTNFIDDPAKQLVVMREVQERTNVFFDVQWVASTVESEQFDLMMAGGDYCDIINAMNYYSTGIEGAVDDGVILDIYPFLEENAPNYWKHLTSDVSTLMSFLTNSGYIGTLGIFYEGEQQNTQTRGLVLNGDWLEEFGMEIPTTYDEYYRYLVQANKQHNAQAFIANDGLEESLLAGFNIRDDMIVVDGEVKYGYTEDGMYDYVKLVSQWYAEGIIDADFYDGMDMGTILPGFSGLELSSWPGTADAMVYIKDFTAEGVTINCVGAAFPKQTADSEVHVYNECSNVRDNDSWAFSVNCSEDDVAILLGVVEYLFSAEGSFLFNYGLEGEAYELDEAGKPQWTDLILNNPDGLNYNNAAFTYASTNSSFYFPSVMNIEKGFYACGDAQWAAMELFSNSGDDAYTIPAAVSLTVDESSEYSALAADIETYAQETIMKWIINNDLTEEYWNTYVAACEGMGSSTMTKIYQAAYDRYADACVAAEAIIG